MKTLEPKINKVEEYSLLDANKENCYNNMIFNKNIESIVLEDTYIDLLKDDYKDIEDKIKIIYLKI